ncbi:MAG: hypothetical protein ACYSWU_25405 [Planctomycetota bacterium]|jgi:hypothetical protein
MMKGKGSPILMVVGLVFLGGWSARAEPPVTRSTDEITEEDGPGIPGSQQPPLEHVTNHEQGLQGNHEVMHQGGSGTKQHDSDEHHHDSAAGEHMASAEEDHEVMHQDGSGTNQRDSDAHHHDSAAGEHMTGAEGTGSHSEDMVGPVGDGNVEHSRMHEAGMMGEPNGGMMSGNERRQAESMMGPAGGAVSEMSRRRDGGMMEGRSREGMMGGGRAGSSSGGMHGGH